MSGSNRLLVLAIVGWLIAASPPQQRTQAQDGQAAQSVEKAPSEIAASIENTNKAQEHNPPCKPGEDNRRSDLCAQWKAADAAHESAIWTRRTFYIGVAGIIIGVLTFGAAAAAAHFAKKAADHTADSVTEARRSADAAEEVMASTLSAHEMQVRPYVAFTDAGEDDKVPFSRDTVLKLTIKNFGQIPATTVSLKMGHANRREPIGDFVVPFDDRYDGQYGLLAPNDSRKVTINTRGMEPSEFAEFAQGVVRMLIRVRIDYTWLEGSDFHELTMILIDPSQNEWNLLTDHRRKQKPQSH